MKNNMKSVLLTIGAVSLFVIALVEISGVSTRAIFNVYGIGPGGKAHAGLTDDQEWNREREAGIMDKTTIQFEQDQFDFGTIKEGDVVTHEYKFTNTGTSPLLIAKAQAGCGCTVPSFPKEPIPPGANGVISVQFNSANKPGHQQKNVMIWSNAQQSKISIGFTADVSEK